MTTTLDVPVEQEIPVPVIDSKQTAKRRIRVLSSCDKRLHHMQRQLCRGRLMHTRSVQWEALVALMHSALEHCRIAHRDGTETSAHRTIEAMWWNSVTQWLPRAVRNTAIARSRIVDVLCDAVEWGVLPSNLSTWPDLCALALYPRSSAHLICGSLGYATAGHAARIVARAHCREADFCEWIDSKCGRTTSREAYLQAMKDATLRTAKNCLRGDKWAPRRRRHSGYMADYGQGRVEVLKELLDLNGNNAKFASWF